MRWRLPIGLAVAVAVVGVVVVLATTTDGQGDPSGALTLARAGGTAGQPIRAGFLGLSIEFQAVRAYTGTDAHRVNPVLVQLIRNLTPDQAPVLRIGGDSTDLSYIPGRGVAPSPFANYPLTPSWLATTSALAHQLGAHMILGINLAANAPRLAASEAQAYLKAFGSTSIQALEIGNEPNVYGKIRLFRTPAGARLSARRRSFSYPQFRRQFRAIAAVIRPRRLAGPALAVGPKAGIGSWVHTMADFLAGDPRVQIMTVHRYPLRNCDVPPGSPQFPTVSHLLANYATAGLAGSLRRWLSIAHIAHRRLRVDELNSVACRGKTGVSDTFASSLWVVDALFSLARLGVDGVNLHTLPNSAYELFRFSRSGGRWRARVTPVYYGLQLFAQAAPPGSRLLEVRGLHRTPGLSVWATRAPDRRVRVVLVNQSLRLTRTVRLRPPGGPPAGATIERMRAPGAASQLGVTLGGRTYGAETYTGALSPHSAALTTRDGAYTVTVPRASAALLTFGG